MTPLNEKIMQMYMVQEKCDILDPRSISGMSSSGTCIAVSVFKPMLVG